MRDYKKLSKFLSLVLRHQPKKIGIHLDDNGWVQVDELLVACQKYGVSINRETLGHIVQTNDKQRYSFSEYGQKIRANQGHSITVDLNLKPIKPPETLFHGTSAHFLPSIQKSGLVKGKRHHVHLSKDIPTARRVGQRRGESVILKILAKEMSKDGYLFFCSANGVWLTEFVPVKYIESNGEDL